MVLVLPTEFPAWLWNFLIGIGVKCHIAFTVGVLSWPSGSFCGSNDHTLPGAVEGHVVEAEVAPPKSVFAPILTESG